MELPTGLIGIPAAAQWLDIPVGALRKAVTAKTVPFTKIGKHVKFTSDHLLLIIRQGEVVPQQVIRKASPRPPKQGPRLRP